MNLSGSEQARNRLTPVLLLAAAAVLLFAALGRGGLIEPDESAVAESAREMSERGEWLVPRLYGKPLLERPVLPCWAVAASFRLLGESEIAARIPSALAGIALLLLVHRLARRIHEEPRAAMIASATLATSLAFVLPGRTAGGGMILSACCTAAILCWVETLRAPGRRLLPLAGAACAGLAFLAGGPAGTAIPVLAIGIHLLATRSLRRLWDLRPIASLLVIAAVALPWPAAVGISRPDLFREFLLSGGPGRFLRGGSLPEPPLYGLVILALGFLPWSAFLPGAAGRVVLDRRDGEGSRRRLLPLLWLLVVLALALPAGGRNSSHILPAFPAAALLAAGALAPWLDPAPPLRRLPGTGAMMALVLLAAGMVFFTWRTGSLGTLPPGFEAALLPLCVAALLGALLSLGALLQGWSRIGFFVLLGGHGILVLGLLIYGLPQIEETRSSRGAALAIAAQIRPSDGLILYREDRPGFAYYLRRTPDVIHDEEDLVRRLGSGNRVYCLMGRVRYERLRLGRRELPLYLLRSAGNIVIVTNLPPGSSP